MRKRVYSILILPWLLLQLNQTALPQVAHWQPVTLLPNRLVNAMVTDSLGAIYAATNGAGIFRSTNGGATWDSMNTGLGSGIVYAMETAPGRDLYAGTASGLYRSTDRGESWVLVHYFFHAFSVGLNLRAGILVGWEQDYNVGLFSFSTDDGATWTDSRIPRDPNIYSLALDSRFGLFAGTALGVFRSTTGGTSWDSASTGLVGYAVWVVVADSSDYLFAGTWQGGIFRSTNGGGSWIRVGIPGGDVRSIAINSRNRIYGAAWRQGVFCSTDSGGSWNDFSIGLTSTAVQALALDPTGFLYAGGDSGAAFRTITSTTSATYASYTVPAQPTLEQNYPNPFNPSTTIRYELPHASRVSLKVYNTLGQEVAMLVNETKPAGVYTVQFDVGRLASGMYFYRLQAGDFVEAKKLIVLR